MTVILYNTSAHRKEEMEWVREQTKGLVRNLIIRHPGKPTEQVLFSHCAKEGWQEEIHRPLQDEALGPYRDEIMHSTGLSPIRWAIEFENESDAMLFKLTFGGM